MELSNDRFDTLDNLPDVKTIEDLVVQVLRPLNAGVYGTVVRGRRPSTDRAIDQTDGHAWGRGIVVDSTLRIFVRIAPQGLVSELLGDRSRPRTPAIVVLRSEHSLDQHARASGIDVRRASPRVVATVSIALLLPKRRFGTSFPATPPEYLVRYSSSHALSLWSVAVLHEHRSMDESTRAHMTSSLVATRDETALPTNRFICAGYREVSTDRGSDTGTGVGHAALETAAALLGCPIPTPTTEAAYEQSLKKLGSGVRLRDAVHSIASLTMIPTLVALHTLPVTRDALPHSMLECTAAPLIIVVALRLAMAPHLFGLPPSHGVVSARMRERCCARWSTITPGSPECEGPILAIDHVIQAAVLINSDRPSAQLGARFSASLPTRVRARIGALAVAGYDLATTLFGSQAQESPLYKRAVASPDAFPRGGDPFGGVRGDGGGTDTRSWPFRNVGRAAARETVLNMFERVAAHYRAERRSPDSPMDERRNDDDGNNDLMTPSATGVRLGQREAAMIAACRSTSGESTMALTALCRHVGGGDPLLCSAPSVEGITKDLGPSLLGSVLLYDAQWLTRSLGLTAFVVTPHSKTACATCGCTVESLETSLVYPDGQCGECDRVVCHACRASLRRPSAESGVYSLARCSECTRHVEEGPAPF